MLHCVNDCHGANQVYDASRIVSWRCKQILAFKPLSNIKVCVMTSGACHFYCQFGATSCWSGTATVAQSKNKLYSRVAVTQCTNQQRDLPGFCFWGVWGVGHVVSLAIVRSNCVLRVRPCVFNDARSMCRSLFNAGAACFSACPTLLVDTKLVRFPSTSFNPYSNSYSPRNEVRKKKVVLQWI
eukprot:1539604-Amphidinium_carterae.1